MTITEAEYVTVQAAAMKEKDLQECVRRLVKTIPGAKYYHTHRSEKSPAGFPDCVILLPLAGVDQYRVVYAELKREKAKVTEAQREWLDALKHTPSEVYLWRPSHWLTDQIQRVLLDPAPFNFRLMDEELAKKIGVW